MKDYAYYSVTYQLGVDYDEDTDTNIRFRYLDVDSREQLLQVLELLENSHVIYMDISYFAGSKLKVKRLDK